MSEAYWILSGERRRWESDPGLAEYLALEFPREDPAWRPVLVPVPPTPGRPEGPSPWARRWHDLFRRTRERGVERRAEPRSVPPEGGAAPMAPS